MLPVVSRGIEKNEKTGSYKSKFLLRVEGIRVWDRKVLPGPGSYPGRKGLEFGMEGASGSWFLPRVEGFRVWGGRCFRL